MRLIKATLTNYRGIEHSTVTFGEGITVVEGPNEAGKSSIAEAIRILREEKSTAKSKRIWSLQPVGKDVGPEVELELRTGPYHLTYSKRWLRKESTSLTIHAPVNDQLTGNEAHERFLSILDETVNRDLLNALDVVQGESLDQAKLAEIPALQRALSSSDGLVEDADILMQRVEAEYERYFTATGRPTKEYASTEPKLRELEERVEELRGQSTEMDRLTEQHQAALERKIQLDGKELAIRQDLQDAQTDVDALMALRQALQEAEYQRRDAERAADDARKAQEERRALVESAAFLTSKCSALDAEISETKRQFESLEDGYVQARLAYEEEETRHRETAKALADARRTLQRAEAVESLAKAKERLEKAEAAQRIRDEAHAVFAAETMRASDITRIRELDNERRIAVGLRDAAAPKVTIRRLGTHEVLVDGFPLGSSPDEFAVHDSLGVEVPGIVAVTVEAGRSDDSLSDKAKRAEQALADALEAFGLASAGEAEEAFQRREDAKRALDNAESNLDSRLDGTTLEEYRDEVASLSLLTGEGAVAPVTEASATVGEYEAELDELQATVGALRAVMDEASRAMQEAEKRVVSESVKRESVHDELIRVQARLDAARAVDDAAVEQLLEEAEAKRDQAESALRDAKAALRDADAETRELRLENARRLVESHRVTREEQNETVTRLRTMLDAKVAEGIYEKLTTTEAELEAVRAAWERLDRSARAIRLLRDTLHAHRADAQARYVAPFTQQINSLGRRVFGSSFEVQVSPSLQIESRTLNGQTVSFEQLSTGTREQLSLIGRLAVAQLVDANEGAPILLDDALGFSDPGRLERFNWLLGEVGDSAQIVVLTCQPERFDNVGGAKKVQLI